MTLNFIDIASWQDGINLAAIPGLDAVVVKATESTNYVNPVCDKHIQAASALGLPIGVYHYAGSSTAKRLGDAEAEWAWFRDNCAGYKGVAVPILDYEPFGYSNPSISWAQAWVTACRRDWGVWPVIYLASYHVTQGGDEWRPIAENCGLWLAQDTGYYQTRMTGFDAPAAPAVADWWTMFGWQYCAQAAVGGVSPVDLDVAYVDRAGWQAYATGSTITTPSEDQHMPSAQEIADAIWQAIVERDPLDANGNPTGTLVSDKAGLLLSWGNQYALDAARRAEKALAQQDTILAKQDDILAKLAALRVSSGGINPDVVATIQQAAQDVTTATQKLGTAISALASN